ncbi:MAG: hypothetical protein CVV03_00445 [Firmicutes bacterium HGW-Firmicutes-8]|nr:MAG: hypothetical protein CVV03_00445 [Firmicutes bacterium HGW-Firmicutes-8]
MFCKNKKIIIIMAFLVMLGGTAVAWADYNFDGQPLQVIRSETIKGELFVDGGKGLGPSPYFRLFQVPSGKVKWARLYVGVWGGNSDNEGELTTKFNNTELAAVKLGKAVATGGAEVYGATCGTYWVACDVSKEVKEASVNRVDLTTKSVSGNFDGRLYGAVLVAALEQANRPEVSYWIAEGNVGLNYKTPLNTATLTLPGSVAVDDVERADLTTVYVAGNKGDQDKLFLNGQLLAVDAADGGGQSLAGEKWEDYFDFDLRDVTGKLAARDNQLTFDRGDDTYLHPVLVILRTGAKTQESTPVQQGTGFTDIENHWARLVIEEFTRAGIIKGINGQEFLPDGLITRAQFSVLLVNALKLTPIDSGKSTFGDVPSGHWSYRFVETAAANGLVSGSNGKFNPDLAVTRQEMTVMLVRAAGLEKDVRQLGETEVNTVLNFQDRDKVAVWAKPYAAMAAKKGFVKGIKPGLFGPLEPATRAQAVVMVKKLLDFKD